MKAADNTMLDLHKNMLLAVQLRMMAIVVITIFLVIFIINYITFYYIMACFKKN